MRFCILISTVCILFSTTAGDERNPRFYSQVGFERLRPVKSQPSVRVPVGDTIVLDSILRDVMRMTYIPGMATMIVQDGQVIWNRCYGYAIVEESIPVTDTTCFTLASISKTFTGMAAMQLWENGYFELDSSINEHLPFAVRHSRYPDSTITYLMLLTHSSAIRDNWDVINRHGCQGDPDSSLLVFPEDYFIPGSPGYDSALNFYQEWAPGKACAYSSAAFDLLGLEVEMLAYNFSRYTRDSIFEPLGMNRTTWFFADLDTTSVACQYWGSGSGWYRYGYTSGSFYPVSFLKSCTRDLGNYLNMWLAHGRHNTLQLLDSTTVELMLTRYWSDTVFTPEWRGLAWYQNVFNGDTFWCHGGGWLGVTTFVVLSLRDNSGIITLTNGDYRQVGPNLLEFAVPALIEFAARPGIAEQKPSLSREWLPMCTFIRGMLELRGSVSAVLFDISGRKVADLKTGTNDIQHLAPGIYFIRINNNNQVTKIIVTR